MKLDPSDRLEHLHYSLHCHIHNVSADASFSLVQVFHVDLESLQSLEPNPLFYPRGWIFQIPFTMTE